MNLEVLLTPHIWLQASTVVRSHLSKEFSLSASTTPRCVTERGMTRIESDGYTVNDLRKLNAESMQKWLGFEDIDPEADLNALFAMCVDRIEARLAPPSVVSTPSPQVVYTTVDPVQSVTYAVPIAGVTLMKSPQITPQVEPVKVEEKPKRGRPKTKIE